jgi:hypothetical protein
VSLGWGTLEAEGQMADKDRRRRVWRRIAALLGVVACAGLLWVINENPGWESWGFLTEDFGKMVLLVNASLISGLVLNVMALITDSGGWRGLRDAVGATFGLVILARLFVLFPFAVADDSAEQLVIRVLLGVAMIGAFIGVVAGWGLIARELHLRVNYRR